eukprot:1103627-Pleurochrysis_carterae.AAC.5
MTSYEAMSPIGSTVIRDSSRVFVLALTSACSLISVQKTIESLNSCERKIASSPYAQPYESTLFALPQYPAPACDTGRKEDRRITNGARWSNDARGSDALLMREFIKAWSAASMRALPRTASVAQTCTARKRETKRCMQHAVRLAGRIYDDYSST